MPEYPPQLHGSNPFEQLLETMAIALGELDRRLKAQENRTAYPIQDGTAGTPAGTVPISIYGKQSDGTVSATFWDKASPQNKRLVLGQMPKSGVGSSRAGDYGLLLANSDGTFQEYLPAVSNFTTAVVSTASTSYVSLAGSPQVSATLGASGDAFVEVGMFVQTTAANTSGLARLNIDSGTTFSSQIVQVSDSASDIGITTFFKAQLSQLLGTTLTPGSHSFALQYRSSLGTATQSFEAISITVTPI